MNLRGKEVEFLWLLEWDLHSWAYALNIKRKNAQHVDLNNVDENMFNMIRRVRKNEENEVHYIY